MCISMKAHRGVVLMDSKTKQWRRQIRSQRLYMENLCGNNSVTVYMLHFWWSHVCTFHWLCPPPLFYSHVCKCVLLHRVTKSSTFPCIPSVLSDVVNEQAWWRIHSMAWWVQGNMFVFAVACLVCTACWAGNCQHILYIKLCSQVASLFC